MKVLDKWKGLVDKEERILIYIFITRLILMIILLFNIGNITDGLIVICILFIVTVIELLLYDESRLLNVINLSTILVIMSGIILSFALSDFGVSNTINTIILIALLVMFGINTFYNMKFVWHKMYK